MESFVHEVHAILIRQRLISDLVVHVLNCSMHLVIRILGSIKRKLFKSKAKIIPFKINF